MQYGLIGAGPVHKYMVAGLPRLRKELGPVAAINRRTASRIVNTLRAGEACDLCDVAACPLILICAPGEHCIGLLAFLAQTGMNWEGKSVVLCETTAFSLQLPWLRAAGASVASLRSIVGLQGRFLVEGDREALRAARYLARQLSGIALEIRPEDHLLYCASTTLASSLYTPLLEACMLGIRRTRLSGTHSAQIVEALFLQTLRTFLYSGRRSWVGVVAQGNQTAMDQEASALGTISPELAEFYRVHASMATCLLKPRRVKNRPENNG